MTKKVNEEQIQELFAFMQRKRLRYYDLQVEMVDHFASAIEELWREDPDLPFERAINKVYDQFPITGFASVIAKQSQAIQREAWRWVWANWKTYFQWPRILLSLSLVFALRLVFYLPVKTYWLYFLFVMAILAGGIILFYLTKRGVKKGKKRFLRLEATYGSVSFVLSILNPAIIFSQNLFIGDINALPGWAVWSLAFFTVYSGYLLYILFIQLPERALVDLRRHFPKYV